MRKTTIYINKVWGAAILRLVPAIAVALLLCLSACSPKPHDVTKVAEQPVIYPDYIGVTIPVEIAPMNFCMADEAVEAIDVVVKGSKTGELRAKHSLTTPDEVAQFDIDEWHQLLKDNIGGTLSFAVTAMKDGQWTEYQPFAMTVSPYPLGEYGIVYRRIAPGFETFSNIGMYQRDMSSFCEETIFDVKDVDGQCMNCHYANRCSAQEFLVHVRGKHGATMLRRGGKDTYLTTKTDETFGSCAYGYWHHEGRYCAFSLNKAQQNFYTGAQKIVEPWDRMSDIVVLDTETNELLRTPLLEGPDYQTTPAFSADGKTIYFSAATEQNMPQDYEKVKYSLCSIAFDAATGTFGETVDTLINGRLLDKSISLARPSYDGKYIMYCQMSHGTTPVDHMDSDLWLMELATGETRPMDEVNSGEADAYHNWAGNSRWFVFGSKREDHYYSLPYFACIGDDGKATKPFLLPQENPREYYLANLHSFNAPDFVHERVDLDRGEFTERIMSDERIQVKARQIDIPATT